MENIGRTEGRKGQRHDYNENSRKEQAPMGFEGMNYEQKRKPYSEANNSEKNRNGSPGSDTNMGKNAMTFR